MATDDELDRERLLGSAAQFGELYETYERPVLRFFLSRTGRADLAADLTAETFARLLAGRERYSPQRGPVVAWMFGIARNVLLESLSRGQVEATARRRLGMEPLLLEDEDLARIDSLDLTPALDALAALPAGTQQLVEERVLNGKSYLHLADAMACSEAVVRQRVSRALRSLRSTLKDSS